jgi:leucyl/phenylalanyl-tRNA--protein transferase
MIPWLPEDCVFPPLDKALADPNGLLAAGGDLSPRRLVAAYRRGIFPGTRVTTPSSGGAPTRAWCCSRGIEDFPLAGENPAQRQLRSAPRHEPSKRSPAPAPTCRAMGRPAPGSPQKCRRPTPSCTAGLRAQCRNLDRRPTRRRPLRHRDRRAFYGESMFADVRDASKIALAHLCAYLKQRADSA